MGTDSATFTLTLGDFTLHMFTDGAVTTSAQWMFPFLTNEQCMDAFPDGKAVLSYGCALLVAGGVK